MLVLFESRKSAVAMLITALLVSATAARSEEVETLLLYPAGAPGAVGTEEVDQPRLQWYPAPVEHNTGCAVVVLPGGGYGHLALGHEGRDIAAWLNSQGISAAVTSYRLGPRYRHPAPLQDAQRALRIVRSRAEEWKLDSDRLGVWGFSAGGHLASTLATHFDLGDAQQADPVDRASCRPDFCILGYPVISLQADFSHRGSKRNLLGDDPNPELVRSLSNETQVTSATPPTFLFHTTEDKGVPVLNSLAYFRALRSAGVNAELHSYLKGRHGLGLAPDDPVLTTWKECLGRWLRMNNFLTNQPRAAVSGSITVKGTPLPWGILVLLPVEPRDGPTVSALVRRGEYSIPLEAGPVAGEYEARITPMGDLAETPSEGALAPAGQAPLKLTVQPGQNHFDFELPN